MRTDLSVNYNTVFRSSLYDRFFKALPNKDIKNAAKFNKAGQMLASPHWNRLALGCAALCSQPFFDYYNPNVDRDTAETSTLRTLAKIPVCTGVGFIVRGITYKIVEKYAHGSEKEGSTLLTPKAILQETNKELRNSKLKLHKNTFSTVAALCVMTLCTNMLVDAPLTTKAANKLIAIRKAHKEKAGA